MREQDWINRAYWEAENASAIASAKRASQAEKCGCGVCLREAQRIYREWGRWGKFNPNTRQRVSQKIAVRGGK